MQAATSDLMANIPLPPGPQRRGLLGDMRAVQSDPLGYLLKAGQEFDGLARFRAGFWDVYLIAHPDAIAQMLREYTNSYSKNTFTYNMARTVGGPGLLTLDGEAWHSRRRLMQPIFSKERIAALDKIMSSAAEGMLERWQDYAKRGTPIDLNAEIVGLTLRISSKAFFDVDIRDENSEINQAITTLSVAFADRLRSQWAALWGVLGFPAPGNRRLATARTLIDSVINKIIDELRSREGNSDNLLVQLANAKDPETNRHLTDSELQTEVRTLLLAGHETVARALTWCLYLLARHPQEAEKVANEAKMVLQEHAPRSVDIQNLAYTQMVIDETLRLYPSVWAFSRRAERDEVIQNYRIPKGARIMVSPYVAHRLPEFWPDPESFQPLRFSPEATALRPSHAYVPFGAGPRQCIGKRFALLELQIVVPIIMRRFSLTPLSPEPVLPEPRSTLTPGRPIMLTLHERC